MNLNTCSIWGVAKSTGARTGTPPQETATIARLF
jgi:hypothetical protein